VTLWEIEETFEKPYEVGGYSITIGGNENEQIDVPPLVSFLQRGYDDWFSDSFYYSPTDPYDLPDWNEWAQFPYYGGDDGMYLGHYAQQNIPFPGVHWENFVPLPFNNEPWTPDRHSGGNNAFPFGNQNLPSPAEVMDMTYKPTVVFYKNAAKHGNINFGNKGVTWFKEDLLAQDAVNMAKVKGSQADPAPGNDGGVVFGGSMNFQSNLYGQVNTGIQQTTQLVANTKQHLAVIDYTEWIAMRDFYLLQKYVYQMNEEEEGTFFAECDGSLYSNDNTTNCYYPGIKNWINNVWYYKPRPAGTYYFRLGNEETHRDFEINLMSTLNSGN
jgi:hypothetical protein